MHHSSTQAGVSAPEEDRKDDHKEGMGTKVGGDREVGIEGGRTSGLLHGRKVGCLPSDQGDYLLTGRISP